MALVKPIKAVELKTDVMLRPSQLNNDIYLNLKANVRSLVEGKCTTDALVMTVHEVVHYDTGLVEADNFSASVRFKVRYLATICNPVKDMTIVGTVSPKNTKDTKGHFLIEYGPILIFVLRDERGINPAKFRVDALGNITPTAKPDTHLSPDTHVKVRLLAVNINRNDTRIICWGFIEDMATEEEHHKYGFAKSGISEKQPAAILLNEDAV